VVIVKCGLDLDGCAKDVNGLPLLNSTVCDDIDDITNPRYFVNSSCA